MKVTDYFIYYLFTLGIIIFKFLQKRDIKCLIDPEIIAIYLPDFKYIVYLTKIY